MGQNNYYINQMFMKLRDTQGFYKIHGDLIFNVYTTCFSNVFMSSTN